MFLIGWPCSNSEYATFSPYLPKVFKLSLVEISELYALLFVSTYFSSASKASSGDNFINLPYTKRYLQQ